MAQASIRNGNSQPNQPSEVRQSSPPPGQMIYVNNDLDMEDIQAIGFDMDYTLAQYTSPQFETLGFDLAKKKMVTFGYPKSFEDFEYDPTFPKRGLWFDQQFGNLLKVDKFGEILAAFHGFRVLSEHEIVRWYPQKLQKLDTGRIFVMHTQFNLPETYLLACIIHFYDDTAEELLEEGWNIHGNRLTFRKMFQDIRACIDDIHVGCKSLKKLAVANLPRYLDKNATLPVLLKKIRDSGMVVFLLTNSGWWFTNTIMKFLLEDGQNCSNWISCFDYSFLDAGKPSFYTSGSPLKQVDTETGILLDPSLVKSGTNVYSGGSEAEISGLIGAGATSILYVGDHLQADIVLARQLSSWRTLMIVPELKEEFVYPENCHHSQRQMNHLQNGDSNVNGRVEFELKAREKILKGTYGKPGSVFKEGNRLTMFGSRLLYWADIYTACPLNLHHYQVDHKFTQNVSHLPHELL